MIEIVRRQELNVITDVVGYPIHANFNVVRYIQVFYAITVLFPVLSLVLYEILTRIGRRHEGARGSPSVFAAATGTTAQHSDRPIRSRAPSFALATTPMRIFLVGTVFGLIATVVFGAGPLPPWSRWAAVALGYAAVATLLAVGAGFVLRGWFFRQRLAAVNAVAALFTVAALYGISAVTHITIAVEGVTKPYAWLPAWLPLAITAGLAAWITRRLAAGGPGEIIAIERQAVVLVAGSSGLFVLLASLPGMLGAMDVFHEGEGLAAARLMGDGLFPWRDVIFIHGLLGDVITPAIGLNGVENSRWGAAAGVSLFLVPVYWILLHFLNFYLYRRDQLFILVVVAALLTELVAVAHLRFLLQPAALLLLAALLSRATLPRAVALTWTVGTLAVLTPEMGYTALACGVIVFLFELSRAREQNGFFVKFPRTLMCLAATSVFGVVWFAYLWVQEAADDFLYYYRTFAPDHVLTGGIPLVLTDAHFVWAAAAPLILLLLSFWYVVYRIRARRPLETEDWVMGAIAILVFLYYPKFLSRADAHVYQAYAVAIPLLFYAGHKLVSMIEAWLEQVPWPRLAQFSAYRPVTLALLAVVLVLGPKPLPRYLNELPTRFAPAALQTPWLDRLGYAVPGALDRELYLDLKTVLDAYLEPGDRVFDFTNQPGVFYYLLNYRPSTRYYHISMAVRADTQRDLIRQLSLERPKFVVFDNDRLGLPGWDGIPNMVRHYEVSEFILENYAPFLGIHGYVLLVDKAVSVSPISTLGLALADPPLTSGLQFIGQRCDWGYAPNFMTGPEDTLASSGVRLDIGSSSRSVAVRGWAIDLRAVRPAREVVVVLDGTVVSRTAPSLSRPDVANVLGNPGFERSGYEMSFSLDNVREEDAGSGLRVFAISADGVASELQYGPDARFARSNEGGPRGALTDGGAMLPISPDATAGWVDGGAVKWVTIARLPSATRLTDFRWLSIEGDGRFAAEAFTIADRMGDPRREISFKTLDRSPRTYSVRVRSCAQWHGYEGETLYLTADRPQRLSAIRLLP